jgi:Ca-activated chloride channel family protein
MGKGYFINMKKVMIISGIITAVMLALLLTGWAEKTESDEQIALRQGNIHYINAEYGEALEFYDKAGDSIDRFLNAGNAAFRFGEAEPDIDPYASYLNMKVRFYEQALKTYEDGILKYPQNVPLKYNYEFVKKRLEELSQENEQNEGNKQESDEGEQNQGDGNEQDKGENGDQGENGGEQDIGNNQSDSGDEQNQSKEQSESSGEQESGESGEGETGSEEQADQQQGQDSLNEDETGNEQTEAQVSDGEADDEKNSAQDTGDQPMGAYSPDGGEFTTDREAINRILLMLESQEEESLKNNREVAGGKDDQNGW